MSATPEKVEEIETAKVELSGPDWQLSTTVSVPKGPLRVSELLPLARMVTDKIVDYTSRSAEERGEKVSCKKGCGACCRQLVPVPEAEARYISDLVRALPEPRRMEIRGRFAQARRRLEECGLWEKLIERDHWREDEVKTLGIKYFFQGIPCPFLEAESCSIHPDRPVTCREYLVTSPAENCAQPGKADIAQLELPFKIWPALARLEKPAGKSRFVSWVPLILALDWAESHPAEPAVATGPELLRDFFAQISGAPSKPAEAGIDSKRAEAPSAGEPFQRDFPLRPGDNDDFARVRSALRELRFDQTSLCRRFGIREMSDIGSIDRARDDLADVPGLILRLFLFLESIPSVEVDQKLERALLEALMRLDIVRKGRFYSGKGMSPDVYYSPVWLYPAGDFVIASDRHTSADGSDFIPMADIVFPGIYERTLRFVETVSGRAAESALELCAGCGIGALALSRTATRVLACDVTGRACHFARFNALLNGCANVSVLEGDLYQAAGNEDFDLVVAHPPYVPSLGSAVVYRDSGESGENLIERIVAGLPDHLRPGGSFIAVCAGWDSNQETFEQRAHGWLGDRRDEFRFSFAREEELSAEEVARRLPGLNDTVRRTESSEWLAVFEAAGLRQRAYGTLVIQRVSRIGRR